jgi:hypothetical protein
MSMRKLIGLFGLTGLVLSFALLPQAAVAWADDGKVKDPEWKHGLILRVRKSAEEEFGKGRQKHGVETYLDGNNDNGLYVSEVGSIAAVPSNLFKSGKGAVKAPKWQHGLSLAARRSAEKDFTKTTKKFGLEVFKDENSGALVYISEGGAIDVVPAEYVLENKDKIKGPVHLHGMNMKVRKAGEKDFNKDTRRFGVEVFKDDNNGNLVYISETGAFAVVPGKLVSDVAVAKKAKDPDWQHGLELDVRKAGEKDFTKDTKRLGVEVYLDEHTGCLVYITEQGELAVLGKSVSKKTEGKSKAPELKHAVELSARKAGEEAFSKTTKVFGVEAYQDENNGNTIYICETGDLAVVPSKK